MMMDRWIHADVSSDPSSSGAIRLLLLSPVGWAGAEWDGADWGDPNSPYEPLLAALHARNGSKKNNPHDALIGVTALDRNMTLFTDDIDLAAVVREFGGTAESFAEFTTQ